MKVQFYFRYLPRLLRGCSQAYPLWSQGTLAGSPAEEITSEFLMVLPIVAMPWGYAFVHYLYDPRPRVPQV
jgi:hypothetical protein